MRRGEKHGRIVFGRIALGRSAYNKEKKTATWNKITQRPKHSHGNKICLWRITNILSVSAHETRVPRHWGIATAAKRPGPLGSLSA